MVHARDPKERFSDRVDDYVRYLPGYPAALVEMLSRECHLGPACSVADLGSGTGILSRLLLATGARVTGVEPNASMRVAAERALGGDSAFTSIPASAEDTTLPASSVDLVTAAQAFHWFDPVRTRAELVRILRPRGSVALIWNQRRENPFNTDYEQMLERFAPEYAGVRESNRAAEPKLRAFFDPVVPRFASFVHEQRFDEAGVRGRLTSSSYAPRPTDPSFVPMMARLREIFAAHRQGGEVTFGYETIVWYGPLRTGP
ncbi:MAG: class I SAM-dependent methyltransferase [Polyangiaceae bacterium]